MAAVRHDADGLLLQIADVLKLLLEPETGSALHPKQKLVQAVSFNTILRVVGNNTKFCVILVTLGDRVQSRYREREGEREHAAGRGTAHRRAGRDHRHARAAKAAETVG